MSAQIESQLGNGAYRVTSDSGSIRDADALFVTRRQSIVFRGSESALIQKFSIGSAFQRPAGINGYGTAADALQPRMLCQGVENVKLFDWTARDPHWEAEVSWVGIHSAYPGGSGDFIYRVEDQCAQVETAFPKNVTVGEISGTQSTVFFGLTRPFTPNATGVNPVTEGYYKARVITYVPIRRVIGVMILKAADAISPATPALVALVKSWAKPNAALIKDWSAANAGPGKTGVPDPVYTYAPIYLEGTFNGGLDGAWVPKAIEVRRQLSVGALFAFTMEVPWEQRITPG